jgi:hypothetical protein
MAISEKRVNFKYFSKNILKQSDVGSILEMDDWVMIFQPSGFRSI